MTEIAPWCTLQDPGTHDSGRCFLLPQVGEALVVRWTQIDSCRAKADRLAVYLGPRPPPRHHLYAPGHHSLPPHVDCDVCSPYFDAMQAPTHFFFHAGPFKSDTSSQLSRVWASGRSSLGDGLLVLTIKTLKRKQCFNTFYYLYLESHPLKIVERRDRYRSAELPLVLFNQDVSLAISSRSRGVEHPG